MSERLAFFVQYTTASWLLLFSLALLVYAIFLIVRALEYENIRDQRVPFTRDATITAVALLAALAFATAGITVAVHGVGP